MCKPASKTLSKNFDGLSRKLIIQPFCLSLNLSPKGNMATWDKNFDQTLGRITLPQFNTTSFAAYPTVQGAKFEMKIEIEFKPKSLDNGIILYSGQDKDGSGDYVSINVSSDFILDF
jgi:hypothetical protein